jgi:glycosyltransferase involved in cell wall biosynthesis
VKVLLVADRLDASSLSESGLWLASIATGLARRGHSLRILCTVASEPGEATEDPPGIPVWRPGGNAFDDALGEALAAEPDVVHVATAGPLGARVVESLRELRVLLDVHGFWPVCPNGDLLRRPGFHACGEHFPYAGCGPCAGLSRMRAMDERTALASAARLIVTHSVFNRVRLNAGLGRTIEVLDYGVDGERFRPDPDPPGAPDVAALIAHPERPRVLLLGPPTPARGGLRIVDLLTAIRVRHPEAEFVVAGRDPENPDIDQVIVAEARELGLARHLHALPRVAPADLPALLAACRVAVAPGPGYEGGGLFVLQAMACGLPVVAAPLGALQDLLHDGETGMFVAPRDVAGLANAVCGLLGDDAHRRALGTAGRREALGGHALADTLTRLEGLYERLSTSPRERTAA